MPEDKSQAPVIDVEGRDKDALGGAVEATGIELVRPLQEQRAHDRGQGQRDKGRSDYRDRNGDGELAEKSSDDPAHEEQRNKNRDQRKRDRDDREADLAGTFEGGVERPVALLDVAHDVLDHDNGVIDDKADRYRQRHQRDVVETVADNVHDPECREQRQWHGHARDHGRPQRPQEQEDNEDDEADRQHHRKLHVVDRSADDQRAVGNQVDMHRGRDRLQKVRQQRQDSVHRIADVLDANRRTVAIGDDDVAKAAGVEQLIVGIEGNGLV